MLLFSPILLHRPHRTPHGRFDNDYNWADYLLSHLINVQPDQLHLIDNNPTQFKSYAEGGATAYAYNKDEITNDSLRTDVLDRVLASLPGEIDQCLHEFDQQLDNESLAFIWAGANDLITITHDTSERQRNVTRIITAIDQGITTLQQHGAKYIILMTLPDLSLAPRFINQRKSIRDNLLTCITRINIGLNKLANNNHQVLLFDIHQIFNNLYHHPDHYTTLNIDKTKMAKAFITSRDFGRNNPTGYLFWNDVHPIDSVQHLLAKKMEEFVKKNFDLSNIKSSIQTQDISITV